MSTSKDHKQSQKRSTPSPGAPRPPSDPARRAAYDVLLATDTEGAYANLALSERLREAQLSARDSAFATELVAGTLRRQGTYDTVLNTLLKKPVERLDPPVRVVLRMGAHQLLSMRVPARAAVDSSVQLTKGVIGRSPTGLVNAVLRKVADRDLVAWIEQLTNGLTGPAALAVEHSHPQWIVAAFDAALQPAPGSSNDLAPGAVSVALAANNVSPRVCLVARPGLCELGELEAAGAQGVEISPYAAELESGDPGAIAAVRQGRAAVQDAGSQAVALALLDAPVSGPDTRWLDLCAGPGGKTALMGAIAAQRHATVLAIEAQPHRAELVRQAVRALPTGVVEVRVADGTQPLASQPEEGQDGGVANLFERVLVDAPCSGLGALRRRPEARWRKSEAELDDLAGLQARLLDNAINHTRPGGLIAYVTCSPHLAETRAQVQTALAAGGVEIEFLPQFAGGIQAAGPIPGTWQLWPHRHGTDAMFLALLRRR